jgi:protein ImuA
MLHARPTPAADALVVAPEIALARARAHEVTGPARIVFALAAAARLSGPVLWIQPNWTPERLMGDGVSGWIEPGRLILARARTALDILWTAEEALRAGAVPLVVAELPSLPTLTATRRLHLAAEAGAARATAPLALLLTPEPGGVPGIETRWRLAPSSPGWASGGPPRWTLTRLRARMAPESTWEMTARGNRLRAAVRSTDRPPERAPAPPAPAAPRGCPP